MLRKQKAPSHSRLVEATDPYIGSSCDSLLPVRRELSWEAMSMRWIRRISTSDSLAIPALKPLSVPTCELMQLVRSVYFDQPMATIMMDARKLGLATSITSGKDGMGAKVAVQTNPEHPWMVDVLMKGTCRLMIRPTTFRVEFMFGSLHVASTMLATMVSDGAVGSVELVDGGEFHIMSVSRASNTVMAELEASTQTLYGIKKEGHTANGMTR